MNFAILWDCCYLQATFITLFCSYLIIHRICMNRQKFEMLGSGYAIRVSGYNCLFSLDNNFAHICLANGNAPVAFHTSTETFYSWMEIICVCFFISFDEFSFIKCIIMQVMIVPCWLLTLSKRSRNIVSEWLINYYYSLGKKIALICWYLIESLSELDIKIQNMAFKVNMMPTTSENESQNRWYGENIPSENTEQKRKFKRSKLDSARNHELCRLWWKIHKRSIWKCAWINIFGVSNIRIQNYERDMHC